MSKKYVPLSEQPGNCHVAIVGMSCVFPKSGDLKAFWENILNKVDAITEVPPERWDPATYFNPDKKARDKVYSKWGGFIEPVVFDPMKYGIPPSNLKSIDPLQLLSLEVVGRALRDAGFIERGFDREKTCCIFGTAGGMGDLGLMYAMRSALPMFLKNVPEELLSQLPEWTEDSFPGILPNVVTGRIANAFDLGGANFTVDAACASGLTAVYNGVRELITHNANVAIVGAADVMQNPFGFLCFAKTTALTPSGKPKPFDEAADGIVISEGLGAVVMKRLEDAERDGDKIYAVIRGVGSSSDGKGKSLTAPRKEGQARALDQAYHMAGFTVDTVSLIEAHGTGTVVGDSTEAESVATAMKAAKGAPKSCAVGSIKSQMGHTKGCAGIVGLIKTALSLYHKVLPPTINVKKPAAKTFLDEASAVYVNTEPRPWFCGDKPRRAGVNSFGFGGTNFHTILEEHSSKQAERAKFPLETWPAELFVFAGGSAGEVGAAAEALEKSLAQVFPSLSDLAAHTWRNRGSGSQHLAIVAESVKDLRDKLGIAIKGLKANPTSIKDPRGIYYTSMPARKGGKIAFLFPGQGSQRPDMLRDLTILFPELQECFLAADRVLAKKLPKRLSEYIYPPPRFSAEEEQKRMTEITVTNIAQPSLGVTEMGLFKIMRLLGVNPDMAAGHSSGEYAALCAAGVIAEDVLYDVLEDRGSSILNNCKYDLGTMLAVKGSAKDVKDLVKGMKGVYVANFNSPTQTIISGLKADLEKASAALEAKGIKCRFIPVSCAFHSPIIEPAREHLAKKLATLKYHAPAFPVYSNVEAQPYPSDLKKLLHVLSSHLIECVRFVEEVENMYAAGARVFVEVGPGTVLAGLVTQILEGKPHVVVSTDSKSPRHDIIQLQGALAQLIAEGVEVNLDAFFNGRTINELDRATLALKHQPAKPSAVSYMVAPDRSWPISQQRPVRKLVDLAPASEPHNPNLNRNLNPPASAPAPAAIDIPAGSSAEVIIRYQQMMQKFMEQQREIMMAFLGGGSAPAPAAPRMEVPKISVPQPQPVLKVVSAPSVAAAARPEPVERVPAAPVATPAADLETTLLKLIAERTGYPQEMLGLDLNIEADLGIDSIKRLEILISFAKSITGAPDDLPEQLNTAKTLREVLAMASKYGSVAATPTPAAAPSVALPPSRKATADAGRATATAEAPASGNLEATLLALVAERTGYPPEMLGLDLDIESDLGIDSIKRLEILIAFAKTIPGAPDDLPEKLNTSRTLKAVLSQVSTYAAAAPAPVATRAPAPVATAPAKVAAPVAAPAASGNLEATLVGLVAERTGYPAEMLGLDLDIESDLGIDSIKRLEILIAFAKGIPGAPDDLPEKLNTARTLRTVLNQASEFAGISQPAAKAAPAKKAEAPPAAPATGDLKGTLVGLVSERTGYPAEMLDLHLDIESDLGIDSIKRLEILIAFAKTIAGAPDDLPEKLNTSRTLGQILEQVSSVAAGQRPAPDAALRAAATATVSAAVAAQPNGVYRNLISLEKAPIAAGNFACPKGVVILTDDGEGCAAAVLKKIEQSGGKAVIAKPEHLAGAAAADAFAKDLRAKHGSIGGVIHLLPLRTAPDLKSISSADWQQQLNQEVKSLFYLLRASAADLKKSSDGWVLACSSLGRKANNGSLPQPAHPWRGGLMGFVKSVADEWPNLLCKIVDTDDPSPATFVDRIMAELGARGQGSEFYYRKNLRWRPVMTKTPLDRKKARIQITKDDVIVIFGGARGITADIAIELAKRYQPTLILAGRSAWPAAEGARTAGVASANDLKKILFEDLQKQGKKPKPVDVENACKRILMDREMHANRAALEKAGAKFFYYQADVQDEKGMGALITKIYKDHGRIDGVINGAGVIEDKLIEDKTSESFDRVFDIKAKSVFLLSHLLNPDSLKFLVLFSSIAGWIGNRGQSDYAAANEVLNRMAMYLDEQWKARVVAIGWGPWDTIGMASDGVKKQFKERGIGLVSPEAGRRFMIDEICYGGDAQAIVVAEGSLT